MKKFLCFIAILMLMFLVSCESPTKYKVIDSNQDGDYPIPSSSGILGNVDLRMIQSTIQGSAIILINGPGAAIGYDIRDKNDFSFIYFADSYIAAGGYAMQTGTQIPVNKWTHIRMIIYKSGLSGYIVSFLEFLGLDFFNSVEDYMIENVYEADFMFVSNVPPKLNWKKVPMDQFKLNTKNQTLKQAALAKRNLLEAHGINVDMLIHELEVYKNK